ncbi:hypothetical protein VPNG_09684 [Cytospora leucostoma]|uniref:DOPA 4,5-dioxygenase n=1 Tax=Cytospora leucostoma TaxID=1230097 RepID=A0A423VJU2_9PEZI|nr:hypothetical protein VPNG_09684 [Cytospora leucostoma]
MTDQFAFTHPSPLEGYENEPPLPEELSEDGKSLKNPQTGALSKSYETFVDPLSKGRRGGFDIHIYYMPSQKEYARQLHERIRREFPELRIYRFWEKPVGPHPYPMFEVNLFTPAQFGAFVPWLVIHRGQLSVLVHPNTDEPGSHWGNELRNHTARATWLGDKVPLDVAAFYRLKQQELEEEERQNNSGENGNGEGIS